jgi:hypothetical protein
MTTEAAMTAAAGIDRVRPVRTLASVVTRVHRRRWLRVLRNGALALIGLTGLLCLLVTYQAQREIAASTGNGEQAISELTAANNAINSATAALGHINASAVRLGGPPGQYVNSYALATEQLTLADLHNIAGPVTATNIGFAGALLVTYDDQARQAMSDDAQDHPSLGAAEIGYPPEVGVQDELADRLVDEQRAVAADLDSWWLSPGVFWWVLLAPFGALLLVIAATSYLLWRGFRRLISVRLIIAATATLALVIVVAELNVHDGERAKRFMRQALNSSLGPGTAIRKPPSLSAGLAYTPPALAIGLVLVALACALVYTACHPRLEEYRYRP